MPKKMRKAARRRRNPAGFICVCVLPALILTLFFTILPTLRACLLSFTNATALSLNPKFCALENYTYMFRDKSFLQALGNTFKLLAVVPVVTIALALILAFVIHQSKLPERGLYRTVLYFPNLVSMTVVGIIWSFSTASNQVCDARPRDFRVFGSAHEAMHPWVRTGLSRQSISFD